MATQAALEAFGRLADDAVRDKISGGDFTDLNDLSLTDEEREGLRQAAADYPEVVGHGFTFTFLGEPLDAKKMTGSPKIGEGSVVADPMQVGDLGL